MTDVDMFDDMDKDTLIRDIDAFHKKYGFKKNDKVSIPDDNELVNFRTSFLLEELAEYTQAITKKDTAAALDALVDIVYIALGTAYLMGLDFDKAWDRVHKANMKKIRMSTKRSPIDIVKPIGSKPPKLSDLCKVK